MQNNFSDVSILQYYHYIHKNEYTFPGHRHRHMELNIILSGTMEISCDSKVFAFSAGDLILIPQNAFHRNRVLGSDSAEMLVVHFLTADVLTPLPPFTAKMTGAEESLLFLFMRDMEGGNPLLNTLLAHPSRCAGKLFEVFLAYIYALPMQKTTTKNSHARVYAAAVRFMEAHIDTSLQLSDITRHVGVCATTLKQIFSRYTGMGCMAFFEDLRLAEAMRLLSSGHACGEVSRKLGFSSQAYFTTRFRTRYCILPSKVKQAPMPLDSESF